MATFPKETISIIAYGHPNIQALHGSTLEITMASHVTLQGDCIIGVRATHSAHTLNQLLGLYLRQHETKVITRLSAGPHTEVIRGRGDPALSLRDVQSLVWRTSTFVDNRTIAIRCDKAARDLSREFVRALQEPSTVLHVTIEVLVPPTSISSTI